MSKAYRVELLVIDHDGLTESDVVHVIETTRYPNRCIAPRVMRIDEREIEWGDRHPLNLTTTQRAEYERLFPASVPQ